MGGGGLGQGEPVVPIAERILYLLYLDDQVLGRRRREGEFGGVASALAENAVLMQDGLGERYARSMQGLEHNVGDGQRIATGLRMDVLGGVLEALANFSDRGFVELLAELFFLFAAEFDQTVYQLGFAPRFAWDFQAAHGRRLHIQIANFSRPPADSAQQF